MVSSFLRQAALLCLSLIFFGCIDCQVQNLKEIDGLVGGRSIVSYESYCGATVDLSAHLSFKSPSFHPEQQNGEIFYLYHAVKGIKVVRISNDTVRVYYPGGEVRTQVQYANGVHFIFEQNGKMFFDEPEHFVR
jgi:hypothetical protein